jgi:hypothetical protein
MITKIWNENTRRFEPNPYDWPEAATPRCVYAETFYRIARGAVFLSLSEHTTASQFQAAEESLDQLRRDLEKDMPRLHYSVLIGRHLCVKDVWKEGKGRLRSLSLLQPEILPLRPEPPRPTTLSRQDVLEAFEKDFPPQTFIGEEQDKDEEE